MSTLRRQKKKFKYALIGPVFVGTDLLQFYLVAEACRLSLLGTLNQVVQSQQESWDQSSRHHVNSALYLPVIYTHKKKGEKKKDKRKQNQSITNTVDMYVTNLQDAKHT